MLLSAAIACTARPLGSYTQRLVRPRGSITCSREPSAVNWYSLTAPALSVIRITPGLT